MFDSIKNTLTTQRLILRPIEPTDAESISFIYKGTLSLPYPYPIDCAVNWIECIKHNL